MYGLIFAYTQTCDLYIHTKGLFDVLAVVTIKQVYL